MRPGTSDSLLKKWFFAALWCIAQVLVAFGASVASAILMPHDSAVPLAVFVLTWFVAWIVFTGLASKVHRDAGLIAIYLMLNLLLIAAVPVIAIVGMVLG